MTTAPNKTSKLAVLKVAEKKTVAQIQAEAVLEQMYGYFSFAPMPTECDDERLAA